MSHRGQLVVTVGSGKSGTNCLARMLGAAYPDGVCWSAHEPTPYLDDVEGLLYEGRITPDAVRGMYAWHGWFRKKINRRLAQHRVVHVANNHLTLLLARVVAEWPDVKVILPVREDWGACASRLRAHGCYTANKLFPRPRCPELLVRWERLPPIAKCVWLWRLRNRVGAELATLARAHLILRTEDLDRSAATIAAFVGVPGFDSRAATEAAQGRPGASGDGPLRAELSEAREEINEVMLGRYDEPVPDL